MSTPLVSHRRALPFCTPEQQHAKCACPSPPPPLKLCPVCDFATPPRHELKPSGSLRVLKILYSLEPAGTEWPAALLWGTTPSGRPHAALARGKTHSADRVGPRGLGKHARSVHRPAACLQTLCTHRNDTHANAARTVLGAGPKASK